MEGPRLVAPAEMPKIMAWCGGIRDELDESAQECRECSPESCGMAGHGYTVAAFEADNPISLAHLALDNLLIRGSLLRAARLTRLATQPDRRRQGLASLVLDHCLGLLRRDGARLLFVPSDRGLFRRIGCHPAGIVWKGRLPAGELPPPGQAAVRAAGPADLPELDRLHSAEDPRWMRSLDDLGRTAGHPLAEADRDGGCRPFLILRAGIPTAYAIIAKDVDEPDVGSIIGYAGDRRSLAGALRIIAASLKIAYLEISVPHYDRPLLERLRLAGGTWERAAVRGAVGLLDPIGLWHDMLPGIAADIGENTARDLRLYEGGDGAVGIRLGREVLVLQDAERLLSLFFGAGSASWPGDHPLPSNLQRVLASCLPLPLPMPQAFIPGPSR